MGRNLRRSFLQLILATFFQAEEPEQEEQETVEVQVEEEEGNEVLNLESSGMDKDTLTSLQAEIKSSVRRVPRLKTS